MKKKFTLFCLSLFCALGFIFPVAASANWGYVHCKWVGNPPHKACWRGGYPNRYSHCRTYRYWRNGYLHQVRKCW